MSTRDMLDPNIVSDLVRNPHGRIFETIVKGGSDRLCASVFTAAELRYGRAEMSSLRLLAEVEAILAGIEILPFDVPAEAKYGGICAELEAAGKPIGPNDLPITAHANGLCAVLVTAKVDEFRRSCRLRTRKLGLLDRA